MFYIYNIEINNFSMYFKPNLESIYLRIPSVIFFLVGEKAFGFSSTFNEREMKPWHSPTSN